MSERATDGLEAFRVNRLRREVDLNIPDERVRFFQPDPALLGPVRARDRQRLLRLTAIPDRRRPGAFLDRLG